MTTTPTTLQRSRTADGTAYHRSGSGSPVVLVHGVGLRAESWYLQIAALEKAHTVFALDMPGHGDSASIGDDNRSLSLFTEKLHTFVRDVVAEPAIVVGHSMGASVALDFAARYRSLCRGVAALSAIYRRTPEARQAVEARAAALDAGTATDAASAPVERWFGASPSGEDRMLAGLCTGWLLQADARGYARAYTVFAAEDGPADAQLKALDIPALFLTGERDENSTPSMSAAMARLVPLGSAVVVASARHMVQLTHPTTVNTALGDFLNVCVSAAVSNAEAI